MEGYSKKSKLLKWQLCQAFFFVSTLLGLNSCQDVGSKSGNPPVRPASDTRSTATSSGVEVGVSGTVRIRLVDKKGVGIYKILPTFSVVNGSGTAVSGVTPGACSFTDGKGYSNCSVISTVAGTYNIKVTSPTVFTGGTITFSQITRSISFSTQPTTGTAAHAALAPVVKLLDRVGNVNTSGTDSVTVSLSSGSFSGGTTTVAGVAGYATFAGLLIDTAGTYTMTATSGSFTATSSAFTIIASTVNKVVITTDPSSSSAANVAFSQQPVASLEDTYGNVVTSASCDITMSLLGAGASDSLVGTLSKTTVSGVADFSGLNLRVRTTSGGSSYYLRATASNCSSALATATDDSSTFTVTKSGVPYQLALTTSPSGAALNEVWATQPVVKILDQYGAVVGNDNNTVVTVTIGTTALTGSLSGSDSIVAQNGVVTFSGLKITGTLSNQAGSYPLVFSATNTDYPGVTFTSLNYTEVISANGLTPAKLIFVNQPSNISIGQSQPSLQVKVLDANNYLCNQATSSISITKNYGPGAQNPVTKTVSASAGVATFTGMKYTASGQVQINAASAGLTTAYSNLFSVSDFGAANSLKFSSEPSRGTATNNTKWDNQPVVQVRDAYGNVVANDDTTVVTLTCAQASGTCTLQGTTSVQAVDGVATFTDIRTKETGLTNIVLQADATTASGSTLLNTQSASFSGNP